ncbi:MAG TPA: ABC transporter ATP-binding protein [Steroidobacteraceae bacterium]|jgi:peptide/nickel transport system ATP-binding protein|nr:ABC transporter ATP-binding protein [Steroidobacteraceae bacterium]
MNASADNAVTAAAADAAALRVEQLEVIYRVGQRERRVISDLSLAIRPGESYGLVGESGCGKSTVALAAIRYLARNGRVSRGRILVDGRDLMRLAPGELRQLRARSVSMVYQDPARALNPTIRIGPQMAEVFEACSGLRGAAARERAAEMLRRVQIPSPDRVLDNFPHELSGGMQQRVIIAMALSNNPALLILDEPTTGLDATVEAEVLALIAQLRAESRTSVLFISHSLAVIGRMCDRIGVLYAGELVEEGSSREILSDPRHPYTVALLRCIPSYGRRKSQGRLETIPGFLPTPGSIEGRCVFVDRCGNATDRCRREIPPAFELAGTGGSRLTRCFYPERAPELPHSVDGAAALPSALTRTEDTPGVAAPGSQPLLRARGLSKTYQVAGRSFQAVHDIDLELWPGETLGLVGESGSGKSSLAKLLLGLSVPDKGSSLELAGQPLRALAGDRTQSQRKALQIVFQNPGLALNRSQTVRRLIQRSLRLLKLSRARREQRLHELATAVRLTEGHLRDKPRQLSGGLQQRVSIARAFAGSPSIVVCDEPTSALDVSVQAAILNLLADLQLAQRVSYLFISHDLNVVRYLSDRIAVLYLGRLLEIGPTTAVFDGPQHPYTEALLSANPAAVPPTAATVKRTRLEGEIPSASMIPSGCVFQTRCPRKLGRLCEEREPPLVTAADGHAMRCHIPPDELARLQRY